MQADGPFCPLIDSFPSLGIEQYPGGDHSISPPPQLWTCSLTLRKLSKLPQRSFARVPLISVSVSARPAPFIWSLFTSFLNALVPDILRRLEIAGRLTILVYLHSKPGTIVEQEGFINPRILRMRS